VSSFMRRLDIFRRIPRDLTEATNAGVFFSLITMLLIIYLLVGEIVAFISIRIESSMYIDKNRGSDKLQVNMDITFKAAPCDLLALDATDALGNHEVDIHGHMFKYRLSAKGEQLEKIEMEGSSFHALSSLSRHFTFLLDEVDVEKVKERIQKKEGCRMTGYIRINKVPGNIHISTHSFFPSFQNLFEDVSKDNVDLTHTINHLSFGNDEDIAMCMKRFPSSGIINPLDQVKQEAPRDEEGYPQSRIFEYYLKIVPTSYQIISGTLSHVFQFTVNSNIITNAHMPSIYFRYDFSPVTIKYQEYAQESFFHFLVHVCAIIGGIFSAASMCSGVMHRGILAIHARKERLGKFV